MRSEVINKIIITAEAVFDYSEALGLGSLDKSAVKAEVEEYINIQNRDSRLLWEHYFRCKYQDPDSGKMLMLFIYRAEKFSVLQNWRLAGICFADDWTEEAEDEGQIRYWLKTKITDLPYEEDWVVGYRTNQIIKYTSKTLIENMLKEVTDAFECKRDKEAAEAVAFLQGVYFDSRERRRFRKKGGRHRWLFSPYW